MPKKGSAALAIALATFSVGCAMHDVLFGLFESGYTDGGTTTAEKRYHYGQQIEAWGE